MGRDFHQPSLLLNLPLHRPQEMVYYREDGHFDPPSGSLAQWLTNNILKLGKPSLYEDHVSTGSRSLRGNKIPGAAHITDINMHAGRVIHSDRIEGDHKIHQLRRQLMSTSLCSRANLLHRRPHQILHSPVGDLHPPRVEVRNGAERIQTRIVEQLAPAGEPDVWLVLAHALAPRGVDIAKFPRFAVLNGRIEVRVAKGADEQLVAVFVEDLGGRELVAAAEAGAREDDVLGECDQQGLVDVEAVLDQHDHGVSRGDGWPDQFCDGGGDVGVVLGGTEDVFVWLDVVFCDVGDVLEDWESGYLWS